MKSIMVVGLGYVGLDLAVQLSHHYPVYGYDILQKRISDLNHHVDSNLLVSTKELAQSNVQFINHISEAKDVSIYIVAVSTPAYYYETPDLEPLMNATKDVAKVLKKGDIVIFESTVYPGTTDDICLPLLEMHSQLTSGKDFSIGYSPERISPGDLDHTLYNIVKIISAQNKETLEVLREIYGSVCKKVYPVSSIKTAEAVKILENTQRDINIAFMNEFSKIMHALNLSVPEIIDAAKTKWSFVSFKPGLVGGHCISVDPLYLAFQAKRHGVNPDIILAARKINDEMPSFIIQELIRVLIQQKVTVNGAKIGLFGLTYKENVKDARNSLALKLIKYLKPYSFDLKINCPLLPPELLKKKYDIDLLDFDQISDLSAAIIIVGHSYYRETGLNSFLKKFKHKPIIMDIPHLFYDEIKNNDLKEDIRYWCL